MRSDLVYKVMAWHSADTIHRLHVHNFLLQHEFFSTSLLRRILNKGSQEICIPNAHNASIFIDTNNTSKKKLTTTIDSLVYISAQGFVFAIINDDREYRASLNIAEMKGLMQGHMKRIYSCMARDEDCEIMKQIFAISVKHRVQCTMMVRKTPGKHFTNLRNLHTMLNSESVIVKSAGAKEFAKLIRLHIAYEREEVTLPGHVQNNIISALHLRKILNEERVFYLEKNGYAIAKAQTNARGIQYEQIGGVYTIPEERRQGFAQILLGVLCNQIEKSGRKSCLFVRTENYPAIQLYENCGFEHTCLLSILYT